MRRTPFLLFAALAACTTFDGLISETTQGVAPGGNPNGAENGGGCAVDFDCKSGKCSGGVCGAAPKACSGGAECASGVCKDGTCANPTATDGVKNADESDVDCGGAQTMAPKCTPGKACGSGKDCDSDVCTGGKCQAPSSTDATKNGDETDVDCGGKTTSAPKCQVGKKCLAHEDCATDGCDDTKTCAAGRSCTQLEGGRTCGETGKLESCCGALPIPGVATKLDKFKVTAGRMRVFVERTNGNVLGWYEANKATLPQVAQDQIEGFKQFLPTSKLGQPYGTEYHLGGTIYLPQRPSPVQGCFVGNAGNVANGSHTYFNGNLENEDRAFDQKFLDQLPLNCVTYPLAAAFCAWDGGRLQTFEENSAAFGPGPYPWGAAPEAGGYANVGGVFTKVGPARTGSTAPCPTCVDTALNWRNNYQNPQGGVAAKPWDYAYWISVPGRFPMDKGPGGHMDIGGLMMELTATQMGVDASADGGNQARVRWSRAGSWEGHSVGYPDFAFSVMTKYGKTSLRCARD